ncbi:hypothetical protein LZG00_02655 [Rhodobacteraceae bacterium LMO-12]|nr:hypothetical protein [Rhodobacteraceae bacterium LMO-JJ12]
MGVTWEPVTEAEVARVRSAYEQHETLPNSGLEDLVIAADMMPDPKPLLKLAKLWEGMRPADRSAVAYEVARFLGGDVEPEDIDIGKAAREAAHVVKPDRRKLVRDAGFDHAVTTAARIWVLERGHKYEKGNTYRRSMNDSKHLQPYPMQTFIAELLKRALPPQALAIRNATPNASATHKDLLRMVDTSLRGHDDKLRKSRNPPSR